MPTEQLSSARNGVIVALKPIVEVNLIKVRSSDLFAQFVGLSAQEWNV
jgi:hypothetical protein